MRSKILSSLGSILLFIVLLGAGEWALRLKYGPLAPESLPDDFKYYFEDIYKDMFRKEQVDGRWVYRTARERAPKQEFPAIKPENVFRVFVIGGSVAMPFSDHAKTRLGEFLTSAVTGKKFEIVGCGMGKYDSYRESLVQREVLGHGPDLIILLSGNNEYATPVKVNPALYKLNFNLRRSRLYRGVQDKFIPKRRVQLSMGERLAMFEENLKSMIARAQARHVPMVLCTLPVNFRDICSEGNSPLGNPDFNAGWIAFEKNEPTAAMRHFTRFASSRPENPYGYFWMARCHDKLGEYDKARERYLQSLDADNPGHGCPPRRNAVLRRLVSENGVILADVERSFLKSAPHGMLDGERFVDKVHWFHEYYPLVSWVIVKAIHDHDSAGRAEAVAKPADWKWGALKDMEALLGRPVIGREAYEHYSKWVLNLAVTSALRTPPAIMEISVSYFRTAIRRNPRMTEAFLKSPADAESAFKTNPWTRLVSSPRDNWPHVLVHASEGYRREGLYKQAFRWASEAIRQDPDSANAYALRALIAEKMGDLKRSKSDLMHVTAGNKDPYIGLWRSLMDSN